MIDLTGPNTYAAVVGLLAVAGVTTLRFARGTRHRRMLDRALPPSGTPASYAARVAMGIGAAMYLAGLALLVAVPEHRVVEPLVWIGLALSFAAAPFVAFTAAPRRRRKRRAPKRRGAHRDRII